jgi:hypothetical protein
LWKVKQTYSVMIVLQAKKERREEGGREGGKY